MYDIFTSGTFNNYKDYWFTSHKQLLTFQVRANSDARVALAKRMGDIAADSYEVIIGAQTNQKTYILRNNNPTPVAQVVS